ncbi:MAG: Mu transposase domain-containing protein, partial [Dehalococcoidia bacterium]
AAMAIERELLLPLAEEAFDLSEVSFPLVDPRGRVKVKTNASSVPVKAGTRVQVKFGAAVVEVWHEGQRVAWHERGFGRHQEVLDLEHYLTVLEHKSVPGSWQR